MTVITITKTELMEGLTALARGYKLFGPVAERSFYTFKEIEKDHEPDFSYQNTRLSPKAIVLPQSEDMFTFTLDPSREDANFLKEAPKDYTPRAIFGIRPCDAKAVTLVRMNFDTKEYRDPYWMGLFEATTFVGMACDTPCQSCFCTTAGCGPYCEEGLDVLLSDRADHYLAKPLTEKGKQLLVTAGWSKPVEDSFETSKAAAESKIASLVVTDRLASADTLALYGAPFWEDVSFACINCGTCSFLCPTCWCFDIQDEVHGKTGKRARNWDSCMFPIFTIHTTGHNPRGTKLHRVRQRFMHKLKYFVDKYDAGIMCVGCGRCIRECPVNIDIRKVCGLMNSQAAENVCAERK
jgi:sulfhydrogenase subunit beta (sulfur reductase)